VAPVESGHRGVRESRRGESRLIRRWLLHAVPLRCERSRRSGLDAASGVRLTRQRTSG
jgi:hypothetical protein